MQPKKSRRDRIGGDSYMFTVRHQISSHPGSLLFPGGVASPSCKRRESMKVSELSTTHPHYLSFVYVHNAHCMRDMTSDMMDSGGGGVEEGSTFS